MVYRYAPETRDTLLDLKPDFIVDCIDLVSCKVDLAVSCAERGIRLVAALGTGNKKDASLLRLTDLAKTEGCPACARCAARAAPPGHHAPAVVYSPEEAAEPDTGETPPAGRRSVPGQPRVGPRLRRAAALPVCCHGTHKIKNRLWKTRDRFFSIRYSGSWRGRCRAVRSIRWHRRRALRPFRAPRHLRRGERPSPSRPCRNRGAAGSRRRRAAGESFPCRDGG